MLKRSKMPTRSSAIAKKGMKYPVAAIAVMKSAAGPGSIADSPALGKNLIPPKKMNARPRIILIIVYASLLLI